MDKKCASFRFEAPLLRSGVLLYPPKPHQGGYIFVMPDEESHPRLRYPEQTCVKVNNYAKFDDILAEEPRHSDKNISANKSSQPLSGQPP